MEFDIYQGQIWRMNVTESHNHHQGLYGTDGVGGC